MLRVERFVNELMTSNCYVVFDDQTKGCVIIDPGSEKSEREIAFVNTNHLKLDYIVITHEHTDHNWGVNALMSEFPNAQLISSEICRQRAKKTNKMYFLLYYDDPDYRYVLNEPDIVIKDDMSHITWNNQNVTFIMTPGHSFGSMCIKIGDMLFTGDTIMPYKPYFNGRDSNLDDWETSVEKIGMMLPEDTIVYPGHGEKLSLSEWLEQYR